MAWNKELAKLKQELKAEGSPGPKRAAPKPSPKPAAPRELDEEDALFLAVMGGRKRSSPEAPGVEPTTEKAPETETADFTEAMSTLKGMKPVGSPKPSPKKERPEPPPPPVSATPGEPPPDPGEAPEAGEVETQEAPRWAPPLIQLAAGMAIDVDGFLDLRGHSPVDAVERLKERLLDGHLLGWRTFHVHLGPSETLRQAFLDFLTGPEADLIARYAQAPIPMGGAQAWILYLGLQGPATH